jgi:hypothetical protein
MGLFVIDKSEWIYYAKPVYGVYGMDYFEREICIEIQ